MRRESEPALASSWWRRDWWAAALVAAAIATLLDAALLQRKNNYFTGGFLTVHHLRSWSETAIFLGGLYLTNLGVTGPLAALTLWLGRAWRQPTAGRRVLALSIAAAPLVLADLVAYRILEYLGSAFDFGLMFELAGRSPAEIAAVAGAHVVPLLVLVALMPVALGLVVWSLNRGLPAGRQASAPGRSVRRYWGRWSLGLLLVALVVSTGLRLWRTTLDNGLKRTPAGDAFGWVVSLLTDVDRDGFGLLSTPPDPAPFDARIFPWAVDWPGNGVDENGVAGDLPADFPVYREGPSTAPPFQQRPTVVLIVLESFRADMVGSELNGKPVTPVLNELAHQGFSSNRAYSHNGYTVQSRFHIFSGSVANLRGGSTLIDDFKANGYQVAYFSAQDESFGGDGLSVGYDRADVFYDARQDRGNRYTAFATPGSLAVPATVLRERVTTFLAGRKDTRPLFLYVNFHDTHFPYHHRLIEPIISDVVVPQASIKPERADDLRRMYMNTAANVDREIGRVLEAVRRSTGQAPGVVVTADHGESLFDEGFLGHGYALNEVQTRVPLVVANLDLALREPWGQADLRDGLRSALSAVHGVGAPPAERTGRVMQYLGSLVSPAQIGAVSFSGRLVYDFREDRLTLDRGAASPVSTAGPRNEAEFLAMFRSWEALIVSRARATE